MHTIHTQSDPLEVSSNLIHIVRGPVLKTERETRYSWILSQKGRRVRPMPSLLHQIYTFLPFMVLPVDLLRFLGNLTIWSVLAVIGMPGSNTVEPSTALPA